MSRVGMIAVGTECALDQSRPLSAFIAEEIGLQGRVRSYEVKHACYGGALALRQALEWRRSGAARGKAALVIATDVALYGPTHPGEPTQGAGAVAMVVDDGRVATVAPFSYPYSEPSFDFWRPVGEAYPRVQGKLSLDCYKRAAESCFADWAADAEAPFGFADAEALCFHVPFPRMVEKAFHHTAQTLGLSTQESHERFAQAVAPNMRWNRELGNNYTASLWFSVAAALTGAAEGTRLAALSYGSGFGAELLLLTAGPEAAAAAWRGEMQADLDAREFLSAERYDAYRASLPPRLADN